MRRALLLAVPMLALLAGPSPADEPHPIIALVKSKVADPSKPFVLVVGLKAKAGAGDKLEAAVATCRAETRKEPGNRLYELTRDASDPTAYTLYERYDSVAALADHLKKPHTVALLATFGDLADGPPALKIGVPVGE